MGKDLEGKFEKAARFLSTEGNTLIEHQYSEFYDFTETVELDDVQLTRFKELIIKIAEMKQEIRDFKPRVKIDFNFDLVLAIGPDVSRLEN